MEKTTVASDKIEKVETSERIGNTTVRKEAVVTAQQVDSKELNIAKFIQSIWFMVYVVEVLISLRFIFLLFGANLTGFAGAIYNITNVFIRPFQDIFPTPAANGSYFDSNAVLALVMWYLLGYIMTYLISLFSNTVTGEGKM